ncbi:MAG: TIGR02300 family protein, partial [Alphaproteobacteria bacterium]
MRHDPIVCPKCGERHVPAPVSKPPRSRGGSQAPAAAVAKPPPEPVVAVTSDEETKIESDED